VRIGEDIPREGWDGLREFCGYTEDRVYRGAAQTLPEEPSRWPKCGGEAYEFWGITEGEANVWATLRPALLACPNVRKGV
jgi:hypothetical protein